MLISQTESPTMRPYSGRWVRKIEWIWKRKHSLISAALSSRFGAFGVYCISWPTNGNTTQHDRFLGKTSD